jgi:hypothetical protein
MNLRNPRHAGQRKASRVAFEDSSDMLDDIGIFRRILDIPGSSSNLEEDYLTAGSRYNNDSSFDIAYVKRKFIKAQNGSDWLFERLGKAITKRRAFLAYRRDTRYQASSRPGPLNILKSPPDTSKGFQSRSEDANRGATLHRSLSNQMTNDLEELNPYVSLTSSHASPSLWASMAVPSSPKGSTHFKCPLCQENLPTMNQPEWV